MIKRWFILTKVCKPLTKVETTPNSENGRDDDHHMGHDVEGCEKQPGREDESICCTSIKTERRRKVNMELTFRPEHHREDGYQTNGYETKGQEAPMAFPSYTDQPLGQLYSINFLYNDDRDIR